MQAKQSTQYYRTCSKRLHACAVQHILRMCACEISSIYRFGRCAGSSAYAPPQPVQPSAVMLRAR